jgi:hypothetical protein
MHTFATENWSRNQKTGIRVPDLENIVLYEVAIILYNLSTII